MGGGQCILDVLIKGHCSMVSFSSTWRLSLPKHARGAPLACGPGWARRSFDACVVLHDASLLANLEPCLENVALICSLHVNRLIL